MNPNINTKFISTIIMSLIATSLMCQNVEITISNIRSEKGQILLAVFKNQREFNTENPSFQYKISKEKLNNETLIVKIDIPDGCWGISVLDDQNNNNKMDYSIINIPKEGFGFSNYYHTGLSKPKFDDFKFTIEKNTKNKICIKIRYL